MSDAESLVPTQEAEVRRIDVASFLAVPEPWQTVGHLYRGIGAGLSHLSERYGEDAVFIGAPAAQATTEIFEWEELTAVTDLASALRAIDLIVTQGEGASGDWVDAHFGKFVGILEDFLSVKAARSQLQSCAARRTRLCSAATRCRIGNTYRGTAHGAGCRLLQRLCTRSCSRCCAGTTPISTKLRLNSTHWRRTAKHLMNWVLRVVASELTNLPIGPSQPGRTAGPTLEIVRPAYFVLPHRDAAWRILKERLDVLTETCSALAREPALPGLSGIPEKLAS